MYLSTRTGCSLLALVSREPARAIRRSGGGNHPFGGRFRDIVEREKPSTGRRFSTVRIQPLHAGRRGGTGWHGRGFSCARSQSQPYAGHEGDDTHAVGFTSEGTG